VATLGSLARLYPSYELLLVSHLPEQGVIFSDGIESDFIAFNAGAQVALSLADKRGYLVMNSA